MAHTAIPFLVGRERARSSDRRELAAASAWVTVPEGKRVRQVGLLLTAPYRKEQKGRTLTVLIPRVEAYQALRVDLE